MTNETLIAVAAWGSWHAGVPEGMVVVCATPGGTSGTEGRRHFLVQAGEYAARGGGKFTIDQARHAEVAGFQGCATAPKAATTAAKPAITTSGAKPWSEILATLGYAKKASAPSGATQEFPKSTRTPASSPSRPEPEASTPAGHARPWAEVNREVEAEGRPAR